MPNLPVSDNKLKFSKCEEEYFLKRKHSTLTSAPFHSLHLVVPATKHLTEVCKDILQSPEETYFIVRKISASSLVDYVFLKNFVKVGSLCAITQNHNEINGNFLSISLSGKLILKLENNVAGYLSLLKQKLPHKNMRKTGTHQICIIDLHSETFKPTTKYYKFVVSELKKIDSIQFDLLMKWKAKGNICCESIRSYFESQNIECITCEPSFKEKVTSYIPVPKIDFANIDSCVMENIVEWISTKICDIKYADEADSFISKFYVPEQTESRKLHISTCQGFYTYEDLHSIIKNMRKLFVQDPNLSFITLMLSGFQCCYVDSEQSKNVSLADKLVCILISPALDYWIFSLNL